MSSPIFLAASCAAVLVAACGGYPAPTDHLANAYANIRAAQALGANNDPQASLHLKLAEEEQARAKELVAASDNEKADYTTLKADADAELAMAMAREAAARGQAAAASAQVATVQKEAGAIAKGATPVTATATTTTTSTTVDAHGASVK